MTATDNLVLFSGGAYAELRQLLPSQIEVLSPSIDQIMDFIAKLRNVDGSEVAIEVALRDALANCLRRPGRGIYLMKTSMDEVHFEQRGTVVHMHKRFKARPSEEGETR